MAIMWPNKLSPEVLQDQKRSSEVRVYEKLGEVLDDTFVVFYSSPWLGIDAQGRERDGECDFLVAHARMGILAIEVKGGQEISYSPEEDQWRSKDRHGFRHKIKDPVGQARSAKHAILRHLKEIIGDRRHIHAAHGVILPGVAAPVGDLGSDRPKRLFCCSRELASGLKDWVLERMTPESGTSTCDPLGRDGIDALERKLAHSFTLSAKVGTSLGETDAEIVARFLEPTQFLVLDHISGISRAMIEGGAGTGKTILAMEEAVRSAQGGRRTLFTCHSRPLALAVRKRLEGERNLTVMGFHELCGAIVKQRSMTLPSPDRQSDLYDKILPNALYEAMKADPDLRFDTIVVDEGQDFQPDWWISIDACLSEGSQLRVFLDCNQNVYGNAGNGLLDLEVVPIKLNRNLRNTKRIHELAAEHYHGPQLIADGPEGDPVDWNLVTDPQTLARAALKILRSLLQNQEVQRGEIAVLLNDTKMSGHFTDLCREASIPTTDCAEMAPDRVVVDTIRRFKGLERPAVIIVVSDGDLARQELAYVSISRARSWLCVTCTEADKAWLSES
jgi:hypothetical protein